MDDHLNPTSGSLWLKKKKKKVQCVKHRSENKLKSSHRRRNSTKNKKFSV